MFQRESVKKKKYSEVIMDETRKLVKGLTKRHKREGKVKEAVKSAVKKVYQKARKPVISIKDSSLKDFDVEYDAGEEAPDFEIPEKTERVKKVSYGGNMLERLKEVYKL